MQLARHQCTEASQQMLLPVLFCPTLQQRSGTCTQAHITLALPAFTQGALPGSSSCLHVMYAVCMYAVCMYDPNMPLLPCTLQYPAAYRSISTLLKWACVTACGMAVDRQLLGSFLPTWAATWRTYVESLLLQVVLVPLVLWYREGMMRRAFAVMWQQALEQQRSVSGVSSSLPVKLGHGAQAGAAADKHKGTAAGSASSDAGEGAQQEGLPDSAPFAAVVDAAATIFVSTSSNAAPSADASQPAAAAAAAAPAGAAGAASLVSDAPAKPASQQQRSSVSPAGAAVVSAAILRAAAQRAVATVQAQPSPSKLYARRGTSQVVHISIKVGRPACCPGSPANVLACCLLPWLPRCLLPTSKHARTACTPVQAVILHMPCGGCVGCCPQIHDIPHWSRTTQCPDESSPLVRRPQCSTAQSSKQRPSAA